MNGKLAFLMLLACGLMLSGGATLANGEQLHVVATHGILADVARNVAGDQAEVSSLVPVGADQHGYIPTPSDLTTVAEADLVLINGAGWEESLLDAVESAGEGGNIVNASACVQIRPFGVGMGQDDHADEHDDDDHGDDDHDDDEHGDEHGEGDHDDEHADDDDHGDDDHDDDEHGDEHGEGDHDDEHADDDDHGDDDHDDDEHGDEHGEGDHDDEHGDDEDHGDEHDHDEHADDMADDIDCDDHDGEVAAFIGEAADSRAHFDVLGRGKDVDCQGGHGHHDDAQGHGHGEGGCDPHVWMDPHNVVYWALMIRDSLSALDHDNEDAYAANAAAYTRELVALEAEFILPALEDLPAEQRVLVTGHDSLGYFVSTYGFEVISTVLPGVSTLVEPSARDVAAVVDVVRDEGVPAIFSDTHLSDALVSMIASETGAEVFGLHTDTLGDAEGPAGTYIDYMRYNVNVIVEALKGDWR